MHFLQAAQEVLQQAARQLNEADQTWANYILTDDENRPAGWLDEYFRADRPFRWQDDAEEMAETLADCLGERIGERGSLYARQAVWQHVDRWLDAAEQVLSQQAGRPVASRRSTGRSAHCRPTKMWNWSSCCTARA